ncbi:MAG: KOW motif-containing protein [Solirubrobacteraceae bacterium]
MAKNLQPSDADLAEGDEVTITEGPHAGKTGTISSLHGSGADEKAKIDLAGGGTAEVVMAHLKGALAGVQDTVQGATGTVRETVGGVTEGVGGVVGGLTGAASKTADKATSATKAASEDA